MRLPDLREEIAKCRRYGQMHDACMVRYDIVSKRLTSVYKSGPSKAWIKVKNPKAPAATRAMDGTF